MERAYSYFGVSQICHLLQTLTGTHLQPPNPHGAMLDAACDGGSRGLAKLAQWMVGLQQQRRHCMVFMLKAQV